MNRLLILGCALWMSSVSFSQQLPQFSQYLRNQYMVNPGAAGVYDFLDVTLGGRAQWLGFEDAPRTTYLYASSPLSKRPRVRYNPALRISQGPIRNPKIKTGKLKHAIGGNVMADQYGAFRQIKFAGTYALHIPMGQSYNLSLGTSVGISNHTFLSDKAQVLSSITGSGIDQTYANYVANGGSQNTMDIDMGLYFYSDRMFLGVSGNQLTRDLVRFGNIETNFAPGLHMYATAGWKLPLNDNVTLMPAALVKMISPAPLSVEGSLQFEYKEWLWIGATYRHEDAIVGMAGLNVSQRFKFGYSYDYNISRLNGYSSGGHEVVLGLMLR